MVIDADHDVQNIGYLDGCCHDDALGAAFQMPVERRVSSDLPVHSNTRSTPRSPHGMSSALACDENPMMVSRNRDGGLAWL